ncbi:MAG: thioredoxin domain-containing protein, partial [Flavobacteriales bacterium]
ALDADSEGVEGKYYVWTAEQLRSELTETEFRIMAEVYAVDGKSAWGEYESDAPANVLMKWSPDAELARALGLDESELNRQLAGIHTKLRRVREERVAPGLDDKILTAWTAMMASGLTATGSVFDRPQDIDRARKALDFILHTQRGNDGRLQHVYHESTGPRIDGMLDDYGSTIAACLDFYQATFETRYALAAAELAEQAVADFYDASLGTFWFQRTDGEALFARKQENDDSVTPSANAQMARNLFQLSSLFNRSDWRVMSDRMLAGALDRVDYWPSATHWAGLLLWRTAPHREVVITGDAESVASARRSLQAAYTPQLLYAGGTDEEALPLLEHRQLGGLNIFVCEDGSCQLPVATVDEALKLLP